MRITFVLPGFISIPSGGVKVVHEYADRFARRGHRVTLIYPVQLQTNLKYRLKKALVNRYDRITGNRRELYYTAGPEVTTLIVKNVREKYVPDADAVIAVGWQTAEQVYNLPLKCGRKFYLLQSFETYFGNAGDVLRTYHLPLIKIAVSNWIIDEIKAIGESAEGPLGNAVNEEDFYLVPDITERSVDVMLLYHPAKIKGAKDALTVLKKLKARRPDLKATLVAARKPVHRIPKWITVRIQPDTNSLRSLYNSSKIFLHTSRWEGWGLPVMEAMACGCAVVATENRGVKEFLIHEKNALLAPIGDTATLLQHTEFLLEDEPRRKALSEKGLKTVTDYSWEKSTTVFENILAKSL